MPRSTLRRGGWSRLPDEENSHGPSPAKDPQKGTVSHASMEQNELQVLRSPSCPKGKLLSQESDINATNSFKYQRLSDPTGQIRLIRLLPGEKEQEIQCRIGSAKISSDSPFEAISYCWGDPNDTVAITCNDATLAITKSLHSALQHFRLPDKSRVLWTDAICINQSDDIEKGHQVGLMREIYGQAKCVLIWLGPEENGSHLAMNLVQLCKAVLQEAREGRRHGSAGQRSYRLSEMPWPNHAQPPVLDIPFDADIPLDGIKNETLETLKQKLPPKKDHHWEALRQLVKRPWFRRMWIVQEVAVSKAAEVHCGDHSVAWTDFNDVVPLALRFEYILPHSTNGAATVQSLSMTRSEVKKQSVKPLLTLLFLFANFQATKAWDKIFALLGLTNIPIQPNYSLPIKDVYRQTAMGIISQSSNLDLLSLPPGRTDHFSNDLPSWAPDWEVRDQEVLPILPEIIDSVHDFAVYCASGPHRIFSPQFSASEKLLQVAGHLVDVVEHVSDTWDLESPWLDPHWKPSATEAHSWMCRQHVCLQNWEHTAGAHSQARYFNDDNMFDVFWQTICGWYEPTEYLARRACYHQYRKAEAIYRYIHRLPAPMAYYLCLLVTITGFAALVTDCLHIPRNASSRFLNGNKLTKNRRIIRTENGYVGIAPHFAEKGDWIALFKGGKVPLVIRREGLNWRLVGDAYVHGIMFGTAWKENECQTTFLA